MAWIPALIEGEEAQGRLDQGHLVQGGPDRCPVGRISLAEGGRQRPDGGISLGGKGVGGSAIFGLVIGHKFTGAAGGIGQVPGCAEDNIVERLLA
jgi:hypothetical protein